MSRGETVKNLLDDILSQPVFERKKKDVAVESSSVNAHRSSFVVQYMETPQILVQSGYQYIQLIGEGANGKTYKARNLKTGETVAIKALKFSDNLKNYEMFKREADVLRSLNVKGVPRFYDYITQGEEFTECWLVQEYIEGTSLLYRQELVGHLNEVQTIISLRKIAEIIYCLQTQYVPPIIHRDIKPSNVLVKGSLNSACALYLIDFGAVANPQKRSGGSTVAGTVGYMAPEQLMGDCTIQSDYYALGVTALHLLTGIAPSEFSSDGFSLQFEEKLKATRSNIHPAMVKLLHSLLAVHVQDRIKDPAALIRQIDDTILAMGNGDIQYVDEKLRYRVIRRVANCIYKVRRCLMVLFAFSMIIVPTVMGRAPSVMGTENGFLQILIISSTAILMMGLAVFCGKVRWEAPLERLLPFRFAQPKNEELRELATRIEQVRKAGDHSAPVQEVGRSSNTVRGRVVAVFPHGTEYTFVVNDTTYACVQYDGVRRNVGDQVIVHYKISRLTRKVRACLA